MAVSVSSTLAFPGTADGVLPLNNFPTNGVNPGVIVSIMASPNNFVVKVTLSKEFLAASQLHNRPLRYYNVVLHTEGYYLTP